MKTVGKVVLCVVAYIAGVMVSGMITGALHLPSPGLPAGTTEQGVFVAMLVGVPLLVIGLTPLVMGLGGTRLQRAIALFTVIFVAVALNTMIEAKIFSNFLKISLGMMCLHYVLPCLFLTLGLVTLFKSAGQPMGIPALTATQWAWRIAAAWLAFPVAYIVFGMCVAPFVTQAYLDGIAGLKLPPMSLILQVQAGRSLLFLASSLPIVMLWAGSRKNLLLAFGLAEATMVGIHGLAQAYWLPTVLRVGHSIEITFDSFAYIAVLVFLFAAKEKKPAEIPSAAHAVVA
jgi:hypothetical protein